MLGGMNTDRALPSPRGLPQGTFIGRETFRQRVRDALGRAAREGWSGLILCDATFADWPLGDRDCVEALEAWARGGQRCFTMLAQRYDELPRQHGQFVAWRRQWSHKIDCRACPGADPRDLPSALWSPGWVLQRLEPVRHSGCANGSTIG